MVRVLVGDEDRIRLGHGGPLGGASGIDIKLLAAEFEVQGGVVDRVDEQVAGRSLLDGLHR